MTTPTMRLGGGLALLLAAVVSCQSGAEPPAPEVTAAPTTGQPEILFTGGVVVTMDPARPLAEAVLVRADRVVAVGADAEVAAQAGPDATTVDLAGRTIVPGFIDAHSHRLGDFAQVGYASAGEVIPDTLAQGWTGLHELYVDQHRLDTLRALDEAGELRLRVDAYLPVNSFELEPFDPWYEAYQPGQTFSPRLRIGGLKFFVDFDSGQVLGWTQDELTAAYTAAHEQGWQIAAKSIGTNTLELILNAVDAAQQGRASPSWRHRAEHVLSVTPQHARRMRELGLVAMFQANIPGQLVGEADIAALIAREPAGAFAPWRGMFDAGVPMAGGTGWPSYYAEEPEGPPFASPMRLLHQAVTRTGNHGTPPEPWMLAEAITVEEALRAYTINAAHAAFTDTDRGSITPGKLADLVVLSGNPLTTPAEQILGIDVLVTMVGGRAEFCADGAGPACPQPAAAPVEAGPSRPVRVAVVAPFRGEHAALGEALANATALAVADLAPADLQVDVVQVDACAATSGAAAGQRLRDDPELVAVLGPACTAAARELLPVLEAAGLAMISASATGPGLGSLAPTTFHRVVLDDHALSAAGLDVGYVADRAEVQDLYARYERRFGGLPGETYRPFIGYGYDAAGLMLQAFVQAGPGGPGAGPARDRAAVTAAIRGTTGYAGVTGTISFDAGGDRRLR